MRMLKKRLLSLGALTVILGLLSCNSVVDYDEMEDGYYLAYFRNGEIGILDGLFPKPEDNIVFRGKYESIQVKSPKTDLFLKNGSIQEVGKGHVFTATDSEGIVTLYDVLGECIFPPQRGYTKIDIGYQTDSSPKFCFYSVKKGKTAGICDYDGNEVFPTGLYSFVYVENPRIDYDEETSELYPDYEHYYYYASSADGGVKVFNKYGEELFKGGENLSYYPIYTYAGQVTDEFGDQFTSPFSFKYHNDKRHHLLGFVVFPDKDNRKAAIYNVDGKRIIQPTRFTRDPRIITKNVSPSCNHDGTIYWLLHNISYGNSRRTIAVYGENGEQIIPPGRYCADDDFDYSVNYCCNKILTKGRGGNEDFDWIEVVYNKYDEDKKMVIYSPEGEVLYPLQRVESTEIVYRDNTLQQVISYDYDFNSKKKSNFQYKPLRRESSGFSGGWGSPFIPSPTAPSGIISSGSYDSSDKTSEYDTKIPCSLCKATGRIVRDMYPPMFGLEDTKEYCHECGQYFWRSVGHSHIPCPNCHGRGYK